MDSDLNDPQHAAKPSCKVMCSKSKIEWALMPSVTATATVVSIGGSSPFKPPIFTQGRGREARRAEAWGSKGREGLWEGPGGADYPSPPVTGSG